MGTEIDGNAEVGRDFTGRDQQAATGNSTNIYLQQQARARQKQMREPETDDTELDRLVYQLSDKLEDLARTVVDLRLEMVKLRLEINQLKEAESSRRQLHDWHINVVLIAISSITIMVAYGLYLIANNGPLA